KGETSCNLASRGLRPRTLSPTPLRAPALALAQGRSRDSEPVVRRLPPSPRRERGFSSLALPGPPHFGAAHRVARVAAAAQGVVAAVPFHRLQVAPYVAG